MPFFHFSQFRTFRLTDFTAMLTSCMESATGRWIDRTWDFSRHRHSGPGTGQFRIRDRNCCQKRLRIWVQRLRTQFIAFCQLHHTSKIHDTNSIRYVPDHRNIMSNKQIRKTQLILQIFHHINYLRLNRNIQCRNRLITDNKLRIYCQSSGDSYSLLLSTGKLMRETVGMFCIQSYNTKQLFDFFLPFFFIFCLMMNIQCFSYDLSNRHTGIQ